jgi:hypothetical protein
MAKLLAGRFNRFVEKIFATKEGHSSLDTISPELQVDYTILTGVEDRYLQGWNRFMLTTTTAAAAGVLSGFQLRVPPGSGILCVVEKLYMSPAATAFCSPVIFANASSDLATILSTNPARIDPRGNVGASTIASSGTHAALTTIAAFDMLAGPTFNALDWIANPNQELTILPGDCMRAHCRLANTACNFAVLWRERVLESSELS